MDHGRLLHQPAARNKLICGWAWFVFEAKQFCKSSIIRRDKGGSMALNFADNALS
jgi:hypothetical protein